MRITFIDRNRAEDIARLACCLKQEINDRTGRRQLPIDPQQASRLCKNFLARGQYSVIAAFDGDRVVAFGALCESHSLYAGGSFGILQEFYVLPDYRSRGIGARLLEKISDFARKKRWQRLELCTPPLPEFERSLNFYRANGFEVTGGRKMKFLLDPSHR